MSQRVSQSNNTDLLSNIKVLANISAAPIKLATAVGRSGVMTGEMTETEMGMEGMMTDADKIGMRHLARTVAVGMMLPVFVSRTQDGTAHLVTKMVIDLVMVTGGAEQVPGHGTLRLVEELIMAKRSLDQVLESKDANGRRNRFGSIEIGTPELRRVPLRATRRIIRWLSMKIWGSSGQRKWSGRL